MKKREIKFRSLSNNYSVIIGNNILGYLNKRIKLLCPKTKKVAVIFDKNVPQKFRTILKKELKNYHLIFFSFNSSEKSKNFNTINFFLNKLVINSFNRSDLLIGLGGGITGDVVGFVASIFKRGLNFINIPTTLLAQVDAAIGGKTGVNSNFGKNLIGSFYQPKLVLNDSAFLDSLSKKEMICGYAEILKHSIINDRNFFNWLKRKTHSILNKKKNDLEYAIKKSCEIKMMFVNKDVHEKGLRMALNFGHTFAHAIEVRNDYSKNITHGEAVLSGMILAIKLSLIKKICKRKILNEVEDLYKKNKLDYTIKNFRSEKSIKNLIPFIKNDKKNDDEKINFILLKSIGKTTKPNSQKISISNIKKYAKTMSLY